VDIIPTCQFKTPPCLQAHNEPRLICLRGRSGGIIEGKREQVDEQFATRLRELAIGDVTRIATGRYLVAVQ